MWIFAILLTISVAIASTDAGLPVCTGNEMLPHPTSCPHYFMCLRGVVRSYSDGTPIVYRCPMAYIFSSIHKKCMPFTVETCSIEQDTQTTTQEYNTQGSSSESYVTDTITTDKAETEVNATEGNEVEDNGGEGNEIEGNEVEGNEVEGSVTQDTETEGNVTESNETGQVVCPESGQYFYAHPTKCSLFLECYFGKLAVHDCIAGLQFNIQVGYCDFPSNGNCTDIEEVTESDNLENENNNEEKANTTEHDIEFTDHDNENSIDKEIETSTEGEAPTSTDDETTSTSKTTATTGEERTTTDEGRTTGEETTTTSEETTTTGEKTEASSEESETDKENETNIDEEFENNSEENENLTDTEVETNSDEEIETNSDEETGIDSNENSEESIKCPANHHHFFEHPTNCFQYVECHHGKSKVHNCPPGLHFNHVRGWCDYRNKVNCPSQKTQNHDEKNVFVIIINANK